MSITIASDELISATSTHIQSLFSSGLALPSSECAAAYLQTLIDHYEHEVFYAVWLNSQHQVIHHGELFHGTIDSASIYPREVVKAGLACNASAVIVAHNHPSGNLEPSNADIKITQRLKDALALLDICLLDHFIVGTTATSMADSGLI